VEKILDAAEAIIVKDGWGAASTHAIASEGGLNASSVYFYFPDRFMIFDEVIQRQEVQVNNIIPKLLADSEVALLEDLIPVIFDSFEQYFRENEVARILTFGKDGPFASRWNTMGISDVVATFLRDLFSHYFEFSEADHLNVRFSLVAELIMTGFGHAIDHEGNLDYEVLNEAQAAVIAYMQTWMVHPVPLRPTDPYLFTRRSSTKE